MYQKSFFSSRNAINSYKPNVVIRFSLMALFLAGCGGGSGDDSPQVDFDQPLTEIISAQGLTGDASTGRTIPSIDDPKAQLGMQLFFTKALSGDNDVACVSCHHPFLGGGDYVSLPIGVEAETDDLLGQGRLHAMDGTNYDGGPTLGRNVPSTFNVVLWDKFLFHDGRIESLTKTAGMNGAGGGIRTPDSSLNEADPNAGDNLVAAQVRFPVAVRPEMRGFTFEQGGDRDDVRDHLIERLRGTNGELATNDWLSAFQAGFESPDGTAEELITYSNLADAIAEYERSQLFVDNPWKSYVQGNKSAINSNQKRGADLFFTSVAEGGGGCASCHSGDAFTDQDFHVLAIPQVGRGRGDGDTGTDDFGRFRETGEEDDRYAFRTPSLLNATLTGPWGHSGAYNTLEAVIRHHLNPAQAFANYDPTQMDVSGPQVQIDDMEANTQLALAKLEELQAAGKSKLINTTLTDQQITYIINFLEALTDPCLHDQSCIGQWVPSETLADPDGLRLRAINQDGEALSLTDLVY